MQAVNQILFPESHILNYKDITKIYHIVHWENQVVYIPHVQFKLKKESSYTDKCLVYILEIVVF